MKKKYVLLSAIIILTLLITSPISAQNLQDPGPELPPGEGDKTQVYIVQLADEPVIAYKGGKGRLKSTKPNFGDKIDPKSANVEEYVDYLMSRHRKVLDQIDGGEKLYDYTYAFNGFAAVMTPLEAEALKKQPGVISVQPDIKRYLDTENSPSYLGLEAAGGLWQQVGGVEHAGENIIVGIIDSGIWPEHPSFSDEGYGPVFHHWFGECETGEEWTEDTCNNKIIGARYFYDGYGASGIIDEEYLSPRDADGHGTHTASTSAGNYGITASIQGVEMGAISGMAPRARIAVYKAIWNDGSGWASDLTAAIDAAVRDGVDVINYSIGSDTPGLTGPDDQAFLTAAAVGVFVATSAGNAGPGYGTVGSPASVPWVTTVGASTQNRTFEGSVILGNGAEYFGAAISVATEVLPLVDAADAGSELCMPGELDPAVVEGKIVLCLRGAIARIDKSMAVAIAGGAGTILYNANDGQTQNTDTHWTPTVHINNTDGLAIKDYIAAEGAAATAQLTEGAFKEIESPDMASFSSRGPNLAAEDLIKPDVTAPGVNILAGNTPTPVMGVPGDLFILMGGTSMSSPHIAGLGALLKQAHPAWSPAMIKSALMTTAHQDVKKEDGVTPADPFDMGAGHVVPNDATDPGLVYDANYLDYQAFLCGATDIVDPFICKILPWFGYSDDASDLNVPSIGIGKLTGTQTVSRKVKNVSGTSTYTVSVEAPAGVAVEVQPSTMTLRRYRTGKYKVKFTVMDDAVMDEWVFGALTWSDGKHDVRIPIAVRPSILDAPAELHSSGTDSSLDFDVKFGYTGDYLAMAHGLVPADMQADTVVDDPANDINTALGSGVGITWHECVVPPDSAYARFSLFDEYTDGEDDMDMYVWDGNWNYVGGSGSGTSAEEVNVLFPAPGTYNVAVHGWQTDGPDSNYTLFCWAFGADEGNMTLSAPTTATLGATETVTVDWTGLSAGTRYLGAVSHNNPTDNVLYDLTILRVDTD